MAKQDKPNIVVIFGGHAEHARGGRGGDAKARDAARQQQLSPEYRLLRPLVPGLLGSSTA